MDVEKFKQSSIYQTHVKPLVWRHVMPLVRKSIKARVDLHNLRYERTFRRIAKQDRALLAEARLKNESLYAGEKEPLISVTITTYNRSRLLVEKTLPAVLRQTYRNFEVVIVGDHCTDDTPDLIAKIKDPRVRFYNLPERYHYPEDKVKRWRIAGIVAINVAHEMSRGPWIAHLDDDELFTPDHLEKLLVCAQAGNFEFVSGRSKIEEYPGEWIEKGSPLYRKEISIGPTLYSTPVGPVPHSTIFYRSYVNDVIKYESRCLDFNLNCDSFRMRRIFNAGVRAGFVNQVITLQPLRPGQAFHEGFHPAD